MKQVTVLTNHGLLAGLWNTKAGLVSFVWAGQIEYVSASQIVGLLLRKQAF